MSDTVSPTGRQTWALSAAGAACVLWLIYVATASDPLFGQYPVHLAVEAAAVVAMALFFVLGGNFLLFAFLPGACVPPPCSGRWFTASSPVIAAIVILSYYGWDLRAVLTTSAIVTAAIGFAMQPTLEQRDLGCRPQYGLSAAGRRRDHPWRRGDRDRIAGLAQCGRPEEQRTA